MKKLLIASTALSLAGGAAFAEMAITVRAMPNWVWTTIQSPA